MGTRGFVGVVIDGVEHIAYNSMSSNPGWLGVEVVTQLADLTTEHSVTSLRDLAARLWAPNSFGPYGVDFSAQTPTIRAVADRFPDFVDSAMRHIESGQVPHEFRDLADTTAQMAAVLDSNSEEVWRYYAGFEDLATMLEHGVYQSNKYFPLAGGHCEWGYLIDLDRDNGPDRPTGVLEVYQGFQRGVPKAGRWKGRPTRAENAKDHAAHLAWCAENGRDPWLEKTPYYKAVAPVAVWALDSLPTAEAMVTLDKMDDHRRDGGLVPLLDTDIPSDADGLVGGVGPVGPGWGSQDS